MTKVPDRGGRPSNIAPAPEMPRFQQRKPDPPRGGGGGYRGGTVMFMLRLDTFTSCLLYIAIMQLYKNCLVRRTRLEIAVIFSDNKLFFCESV